MEIKTFSDGYSLTFGGKDYKYKGKKDYVIQMIADKVQELLILERNKLVDKLLSGDAN